MGLLIFYLLELAIQKKTGLHDCCCLFWDARLRTRLGYDTVIVYFGTCDTKEERTMRLLLFVLGRATQKKSWHAQFKEDLAIRLLLFVSRHATQQTTELCNCSTWLYDFFFLRANQQKS